MANEITCEKHIIKELFDLWYCVPEYQRPYVWDTDQVKELIQDTLDAYHANSDAQYFLGSMVLKNNQKTENNVTYEEFELLDGQQRLTTIFLFLACVRDIALREKLSRKIVGLCKKAIFQEEDEYDNTPERLRIVFEIREDVKDFVDKYIKADLGTESPNISSLSTDKDADISIRNMANAVITIRGMLQENMSDIPGYITFFWNKVLMIYVSTEELQDAFQLFTVLNNRGVKLTNSDIIKAENLRAVPVASKRSSWAKKWEAMESYFGEDFDKFLSHIRTILVKRKSNATLLKEFEENIYSNREFNRTTKQYEQRTPLLKRGEETFEFIDEFYQIYMELFDKDHYETEKSYEIYNYLRLMNDGLGSDYWIAPVLDYYRRYHTDGLSDFLKALDKKVSADWIVAYSPTKRIENVNAILKSIEKSRTKEDVLSSSCMEIDGRDFERIINGDVYGKRFARYLMLKLDLLYQGSDTKFNPPVTISIEHILPQNPSPASTWCMDFSPLERDELTDRLGNLALISRRKNTALGNLDFEAKKKRYFEKNIEVFPNSVRIYNGYKSWHPNDLMGNHKEVVLKLLKAYGITPSEFTASSFQAMIKQEDNGLFYLTLRDSYAQAKYTSETKHMIAQKGSRISSDTVASLNKGYAMLRDSLIQNGTIVNGRFVTDYEFESPSAAASVISGRTANGRTEWLTKSHHTIDQIESALSGECTTAKAD